MAGNVWSWTMEKNSSNRIARGGYFDYSGSGSGYPASYRFNGSVGNTNYSCGFRCVLYIKGPTES